MNSGGSLTVFSIIIPCYNVSDKIEDLFQAYNFPTDVKYEVIFVDDCSPDNTYEQMHSAFSKNDKFYVYKTSENGGPGVARNIGLQKASGDYVIFCDSDDVFDISVIETLNELVVKEHEFDLLVSPFKSRRGRKIYNHDRFCKYKNLEKVVNYDVARDDGHPWAKVFKKSIIDEYAISFPKRMTGEDKCFLINYLAHSDIILKFDYNFYTYVTNKKSVTHLNSKKELSLPTTFEILQPFYKTLFPEIEIEMFVNDHLLARAKQMSAAKCKNNFIKNWFSNENGKYPDWIDKIDFKNQNLYRKLIYKAMYRGNAFLIKLFMTVRRIIY